MRATILPYAIILTKVHRAVVSIMAKGCICGLSTASEGFLIFTSQLNQYSSFFFYFHYLVMSLKYSFLDISKQQYFMLLNFGG